MNKKFDAFQKALHFREQEGVVPNIRVAKWQIARSLRHLNRTEESLSLLLHLKHQYETLIETSTLDIPIEMLPTARGLIYADLAENLCRKKRPSENIVCQISL